MALGARFRAGYRQIRNQRDRKPLETPLSFLFQKMLLNRLFSAIFQKLHLTILAIQRNAFWTLQRACQLLKIHENCVEGNPLENMFSIP